MKRETAEKIIAAMKEIDVVQDKLHMALWEIEDKEERQKCRGICSVWFPMRI